MPEVEGPGEFTLAPISPKGIEAGQLAPNDERLYRTINRPLLVAGRLPDPGRADELVVNRKAASELGLGVGDRVTMTAGLELFGTGESGAGPSVEATVVGVGDGQRGVRRGRRADLWPDRHPWRLGFHPAQGRKPAASDEVVLGPASAKALGVHVGATMQTADGRNVRIVGIGLMPQTPHFSFDQGAWVSDEGFDSLAPPGDGAAPRERTVLVRFPKGSSLEEGVTGLEERFGHMFDVETSTLPQDFQYLRNVRPLPRALAAFLVLLGVGALGHVLTSTVRRRRHDLAVLRALGFRPLQVAGCVSWQAITVSVVALVVGIPLGIAAGRWSWRWVADSTPLFYAPPLAGTVAVVSVPAALLLANAMAALPARRAARLRPADVLRAE